MKNASSPSLVFTRAIPASAAEVYEAWTASGLMRKWLTPGTNTVIEARTDVRVGGAFLIRSAAPDGALHTIQGVYRELEPARRIVMTWNYSGPIELLREMETLLVVDLVEEMANLTSMTLTHSQIATQEAADAFCDDWPSCFDKLERVLGSKAGNKEK